MQRRVFDVDGKPHVVSRDGLYFETHATLAPMIAGAAEMPAPEPVAAVVAEAAPVAPAAPASVAAPALAAAPEATPEAPGAEPEAEDAPRRAPRRRLAKPEAEAAPGEARKPTRRRTMVERAEELFAATAAPAEAAEAPSPHTLSLPVEDSAQGAEAAARRRQRVAEAPRWQVAGALRRGRQPRA